MSEESALRILFREIIREYFDLVEAELRSRGIGTAPPRLDAYSVREAAKAVGLSAKTIERRVNAGVIPTEPGLPTRIPADFVQRMMNQSKLNAS